MAKILCVLYDDPVDGYPKSYARDDLPKIDHYPGGQTLPTPKGIDFQPGAMLGSVSGELGLRKYLESQGHTFVVTSDKDGPNSVFERELVDADIVISQPFWPAYLTAERIAKAKNLKMAITAGIGSDHVDLKAASERNISVVEVTYCNSISVSEHVVMMILGLVRNYIPSYQWVVKGGWNIADCVARSYDVEGMHVGTVAAGRIGLAVLRRLKPFDMHLHYYDRHRLSAAVEKELGLIWHDTVEDMVKVCDVVTINAPLHPETEHMFNDKLLAKMKRGAYLVNTARGKICDRDAIVRALESGQLAGYAGDVWFPQPPPADHPWRTMPHHGMTPHISGTSLSAQTRYAAGVREILECFFENRPIRDEYLIVQGGKLAGTGAHSYSEGNATKGSEDAARFGEKGLGGNGAGTSLAPSAFRTMKQSDLLRSSLTWTWRAAAASGLGGFIVIFLLAQAGNSLHTMLLIAPFGASCVLVFALPQSPLAQPRNVIGGHLISTTIGLVALSLFGSQPFSLAIAVGVAIAAMELTRTLHPPAGADPIVVILAKAGWIFLLSPVLAGAVTIVLVAFLYHRLASNRPYPAPPPQK